MSSDLTSRFTSVDNFYLAFKKLKYYLSQGNEWYNPVELAVYEGNLATNLEDLARRIREDEYSPSIMQTLPFPKKNNKQGTAQLRQYFRVSMEDQIVWIALTNIIGRFCEENMPFWSYGNRLYQPVWFEEEDGHKKIQKGGYGSFTSHLYRKWNQSWPLYRRHLSLTVKMMGYNRSFEASKLTMPAEIEMYAQTQLASERECLYLDKNFWQHEEQEFLYWAALDFKNFFPSLKIAKIVTIITALLVKDDGTPRDDVELILRTLTRMSVFKYSAAGIDPDNLRLMGLDVSGQLDFVPTGLLVSGFLANIAMLEVDKKVDRYIKDHRNCAVFKFVDDHTFLSYTHDGLLDLLNFYHATLKQEDTGAVLQEEKIEPSEALEYSFENGFSLNGSPDLLRIEVAYPGPLMTMTLQLMSNLNEEEYALMDSAEIDKATGNLTHFLLADIPDSEMKTATRVAFAAAKLCQLGKRIMPDFNKFDKTLTTNINEAKRIHKHNPPTTEDFNTYFASYISNAMAKEISLTRQKQNNIFNLLLKAARSQPDKLKLWKRCVEFCYNTGIERLKDILDHINLSALHELGKLYVRTFVIRTIDEYLLISWNRTWSGYNEGWSMRNNLIFFRSAQNLTLDTVEDQLPFVLETTENHQLFTVFSTTSIKGNNRIFDLPETTQELDFTIPEYTGFRYNFFHYFYFLLQKAENSAKLRLWEKNIEKVELSEEISWSILLFFPRHIPSNIFSRMLQSADQPDRLLHERRPFTTDGNGILYDVRTHSMQPPEGFTQRFPIIARALEQHTNYISIDQWLYSIMSAPVNKNWIDPRLSEWTFLEIICQIAKAIKEKEREAALFESATSYYLYIHPSNYLIPISWQTNGRRNWNEWRNTMKENPIRIREEKDLLHDDRYFPVRGNWQEAYLAFIWGSSDMVCIVCLSVLLNRLLAHSFEWPSSANKLSFVDQLLQQSAYTMEHSPVSSDTRLLLNAIFSKRNLNIFGPMQRINLTDQTSLTNLGDFVAQLEINKKNLAKYQLDLYNHMPRQLTVIDIDKLNNSTSLL